MPSYDRKVKYTSRELMDAAPAPTADGHRKNSPYSGRPLPISGALATRIKDSFGLDASQLSLRESPEVEEMGARAMAQGDSIRFAPGEFRPDSGEGLAVLGHELGHVVQQAKGGVRANVPGSNFNVDAGLEAAGDRMGSAFAAGSLHAAGPVSLSGVSAEGAPAQGLFGSNARKRRKAEKKQLAEKRLANSEDIAREMLTENDPDMREAMLAAVTANAYPDMESRNSDPRQTEPVMKQLAEEERAEEERAAIERERPGRGKRALKRMGKFAKKAVGWDKKNTTTINLVSTLLGPVAGLVAGGGLLGLGAALLGAVGAAGALTGGIAIPIALGFAALALGGAAAMVATVRATIGIADLYYKKKAKKEKIQDYKQEIEGLEFENEAIRSSFDMDVMLGFEEARPEVEIPDGGFIDRWPEESRNAYFDMLINEQKLLDNNVRIRQMEDELEQLQRPSLLKRGWRHVSGAFGRSSKKQSGAPVELTEEVGFEEVEEPPEPGMQELPDQEVGLESVEDSGMPEQMNIGNLSGMMDPAMLEQMGGGDLSKMMDPAMLEQMNMGDLSGMMDPAMLEQMNMGDLSGMTDLAMLEQMNMGDLSGMTDPAMLEQMNMGDLSGMTDPAMLEQMNMGDLSGMMDPAMLEQMGMGDLSGMTDSAMLEQMNMGDLSGMTDSAMLEQMGMGDLSGMTDPAMLEQMGGDSPWKKHLQKMLFRR